MDDTDVTTTGSVTRPTDRAVPVAIRSGPAEADLAYARAAASDVLASGGKDASVPWQNPQTGASGNIMPLDTAYREDGQPCRDFLASYMHGRAAGLAARRRLPHLERRLGSHALDAA